MKQFFLVCLVLIPIPVGAEGMKVVDESGATVEKYEVMWHTGADGYSRWQAGNRFDSRGASDAEAVDVIVRSKGYATAVHHFEDDSLADLHAGNATITLQRGKEVRLKLNVPAGMDVPEDFLPQMYFPEFAKRVRIMWQPANLRNGRSKPDFNMLNVSRISDRVYSFRLPAKQTPFLVAFQHPGWLRFFEVGPLSNLDIKEGVLEIDVPRPATIQVTLDTGDLDKDQLPFTDAWMGVFWADPEMEDSIYSTTLNERIKPGETRTFSGLGPGHFSIWIRTEPKEGVENLSGTEINPGRFSARREMILSAGAGHAARIQWVPFDKTAHRGECQARVKLLTADGRPAAGLPLKVSWYDGHYGAIVVHDTLTPENGVVQLDKISSEVVTDSPYGPYGVQLDGDTVGWFRLQPITDLQEFEFRMTPDVGDQSPEIHLIAVDTGKAQKLSDLQGRVVLLEFWATWCGPCQPAMKKLNAMAAENSDWADKVAIIPLSVDKSAELAADHVVQRGWTDIRHFWSKPVNEGQSQAEQAFVVHGIPIAILLKRDGTIAWRGHPMGRYSDDGISLQERIEALLNEE